MAIKRSTVDSIEDIEFDLIKQGKMKESNKDGYVNNKELYQECVRYYKMKQKAIAEGKPIPGLTDKQGRAILQIAHRRANSKMYVGYTNNWKDELIFNGISTAAARCHNFNPEKSENPFAYYTTIIDNAFKEQLKIEKKQMYIKYKCLEDTNGFYGDIDEENVDAIDIAAYHEYKSADVDRAKFIDTYEKANFNKNKDLEEERQPEGLELYFEDNE